MADETREVRIVYTVDIGEAEEEAGKLSASLEEVEAAAKASAAPVDAVGKAAAGSADDLKETAAAANAAAAAVAKTGDKAKEGASKLGTAADAGKKLKGALDTILPGAGSVVGALDDMADAQEGVQMAMGALGKSAGVVGVALGALALSVAAVAAAYNTDAANAQRILDLRATEARYAQDLRGAEQALAAAKMATAIATGKMSEGAAAELQIRRAAQAQVRDYITSLSEERKAISEQIESTEKWATAQRYAATAAVALYNLTGAGAVQTAARALAAGKTFLQVAEEDIASLNERLDAYTGFNQSIDVNRQKLTALASQEAAYADTVQQTTKEQVKAEKATRARAAAEQETAKWLAAMNAEAARQQSINAANVAAYENAIGQFNAAEQAAITAMKDRTATESEQLTARKRARIDALTETYDAERAALSGNLSAQETLYQEYARAVAAIEQDASEQRQVLIEAEKQKRAEARAEELAAAKAAAEEEIRQRREVANAGLAVTNDYLALVGEGYAALAKKAGASQAEVFKIQKAAAISGAAIQAAQAVLNALATVPFPLTPAAVALAIATGAVQIGKIASAKAPSFRGGGMIGAEVFGPKAGGLPDARVISAEDGEGVLTRQGVEAEGGPEGVRARNAGVAAAPVSVDLRLRHEVMDRVIGEQLERPSALRAATNSSPRARGVVNPYIQR